MSKGECLARWYRLLLVAAVTGFRLLTGFLTNKLMAWMLGPAGYAAIGQFQNLYSLSQGLGSLSLGNGWIALSARHADNRVAREAIWKQGGQWTLWASAGVACLLILVAIFAPLHAWMPAWPLAQARWAVALCAPGAFAATLTIMAQGMANGLEKRGVWSVLSIGTAVSQFAWIAVGLIWCPGWILPVLATQALGAAVVSLLWVHRQGFRWTWGMPWKQGAAPWMSYALMGLLPMVFAPVAQTLVRTTVGRTLGWEAAGLWQGAIRLSDFLSVGMMSMLSALVLPRYSRSAAVGWNSEMTKGLAMMLGVSTAMVIVFVALRAPLIVFALSDQFLELEHVLVWQWVGDIFRSGCAFLGTVLLARQATRRYMLSEICAQVLYVGLAQLLIANLGLQGPFIAYAMENAFSLVLLVLLLRSSPRDHC